MAVNIREQLRLTPLLKALDESQLERAVANARAVDLGAGSILFHQGEPAQRFYVVVEGRLKLSRISPAGGEKVIEVVGAGGTFAEALMFLNAPTYPVNATALERSVVIGVESREFTRLLRESVDTCFQMLGHLSQRVRALVREIDDLSLHSASCRLAAYLTRRLARGDDHLELDVSKQVLASRLSIKPETFSRIVKDLCVRRLIDVDGRKIQILDRDGLQDMADVCASTQDTLADSFHAGHG